MKNYIRFVRCMAREFWKHGGNQESLLNQTKILSIRALETSVKDKKQNDLFKPLFEVKSVHVSTNLQ